MPLTLSGINALTCDQFVTFIGPVYEHSPWIAEDVWSQRPFTSVEILAEAMQGVVRRASEKKQLALISAHPDLVGRAALAGTLTPTSQAEQAGAGLTRLTQEEIAAFESNNAAYREKFGFPFVICARLNKKEAILNGFATRLQHSREQEIAAALAEIGKIARLRLQDLLPAQSETIS